MKQLELKDDMKYLSKLFISIIMMDKASSQVPNYHCYLITKFILIIISEIQLDYMQTISEKRREFNKFYKEPNKR